MHRSFTVIVCNKKKFFKKVKTSEANFVAPREQPLKYQSNFDWLYFVSPSRETSHSKYCRGTFSKSWGICHSSKLNLTAAERQLGGSIRANHDCKLYLDATGIFKILLGFWPWSLYCFCTLPLTHAYGDLTSQNRCTFSVAFVLPILRADVSLNRAWTK